MTWIYKKKVIEKIVDVEAKASLQPPFGTKKINSKCLKSYKPSAKKEKYKANPKHQDGKKDNDKAKFHNLLSANISLSQTLISKKKQMSWKLLTKSSSYRDQYY